MIVSMIFILPYNRSMWSNMNYFSLIDLFVIGLIMQQIYSQTIFIAFKHFNYSLFLSTPLKNYDKLFRNTSTVWLIRRRIKKFNEMYIYFLKKNQTYNKYCVQQFFSLALSINLLINVCFISNIFLYNLQDVLKAVSFIIIPSQMIFIILESHYLIRMSNSLKRSIPTLFKQINCLKNDDNFQTLRYSLVYQKLQTSKPFRYKFATLGSITQKNILCFCFFYSSCMMFFVETIRKNIKISK